MRRGHERPLRCDPRSDADGHCSRHLMVPVNWMLGAGLEPAWNFVPRDFKSLASTHFAIRAIAQ